MQGKKRFRPRLFSNFRLDEFVPDNNFYKILKKELDLNFIYKSTKSVYSHTGRPGLDPVVFFKMLLAGYLENCPTDRGLERLFQMRMDLRYFIDHDIDEPIPDHSTICKTRKRIPQEIFSEVFEHILSLCVKHGMVDGTTQSIDSAYIDANASLDNMEKINLIDRDPDEFLKEVFDQDLPEEYTIKDKIDRVKKIQKDLLVHKRYRKRKYNEQQQSAKKNKGRVLSNATHVSKSDPDARIAVKPGKPRMFCYTSTMSVDTQENVITSIAAEHASNRDSKLLMRNVHRTDAILEANNLTMCEVLADTAFSSGENYEMLENMGITAFIPAHGTYVSHRKDFRYDGRRDAFICQNGQALKTTYSKAAEGRKVVVYRSKKKICDQCVFRKECVSRNGIKEIQSTPFKREYERMIKRLKTKKGKQKYNLRMHTVEPVFGSLQQYYGLRRIYTRGKESAFKGMLMSASAFNLKKWLKNVIQDASNFSLWNFSDLSESVKCIVSQNLNLCNFNRMSYYGGCQQVRCV